MYAFPRSLTYIIRLDLLHATYAVKTTSTPFLLIAHLLSNITIVLSLMIENTPIKYFTRILFLPFLKYIPSVLHVLTLKNFSELIPKFTRDLLQQLFGSNMISQAESELEKETVCSIANKDKLFVTVGTQHFFLLYLSYLRQLSSGNFICKGN